MGLGKGIKMVSNRDINAHCHIKRVYGETLAEFMRGRIGNREYNI